jgi:O-antigen/teichoic acid export membrane protein
VSLGEPPSLRPRRALLGGSALLLVTLNIANALHFGFHMAMARALGAAGYSALASLLALLYVMNVGAESIQTVIARYTSREADRGRLHDLLRRGLRRGWRLTALSAVVYLAGAAPAARLLRVPLSLMLLFGGALLGVCVLPVLRGALQGRQRFAALGINMILEGALKLAAGIALVAWGAAEYGAVAAVGISFALALIAAFWPLRDLFAAPATPSPAGGIYRYSLPVLVVTATVMGFYSLDVLLARAIFPAAVAGTYAVASFVSKTLLLGTAPVTKAMFPLSTEVADREKSAARRVLAQSLGLLAACVVPAVAVCALLPSLLIRIVGGASYAAAAPLLPPLALAMGLMAFSQAFLLYRLSTGHLRLYGLLPLWVALEAAGLYRFGGASPERLAQGVLAMNGLFLVGAVAHAALSRRGTPSAASA